MVEVIKYDVTKDGGKIVSVGGGTYYNQGESQSGTTPSEDIKQLWKNSVGSNSLIPADSSCVAEGSNSVAVGVATTTTSDGELACGTYNDSNECTIFSVGDGEGSNERHNAFEVCSTGITTTNAVFSGDVQANHAIFNSEKVNGLLDANQLQAVSAYVQTLLSDQITTDYLTVTKAAHFFKLIIDEIKATQGQVIITPANAKLDKVENISGGWRCYFRAKDAHGQEISNSFEVNDQVVCQTFNVATGVSYNVSNRYYWRLITATGSTTTTISGETVDAHYFDLSANDCDLSSMTPSVGDECVQLGNRTDNTRQAAIIISAYNSEFLDKGLHAPSIVQYAGINNYDLSTHRLNVISNGLNQFKGSYNNNSGKNIETIITETATTLNGEIVTLSGTVTSHTQSISQLEQTDSSLSSRISANTTSIGTLNSNVGTISGNVQTNTTNISTLQQTAQGLTSTVQSQGQSITNLSNSVTNLNSSVTTNTQNISSLQQTAQGLTSTVSSHTQSITNLSNDVQTIENDYVTSSVLQQTATGISASVTSDISGKLLNTGININSNMITMSSDNTEFVSASGSKTWLVGKSSNGSEIFRLGRDGNYSAELYIKNADNNYTRLKPNSIYVEKGLTSWGVSVEDNYPFMQMYNSSGERLAIRLYNNRLEKQTGSSTTWIAFNAPVTRTISSNTTLNASDEIIFCSNSSEITVTLPTSGNYTGRIIKIIRTGTGNVKISGNIRGSSRTVVNDNQYEIQEYIYNGSTWASGYQQTV